MEWSKSRGLFKPTRVLISAYICHDKIGLWHRGPDINQMDLFSFSFFILFQSPCYQDSLFQCDQIGRFIFLVKSLLDNLCRHLAIFSGHTGLFFVHNIIQKSFSLNSQVKILLSPNLNKDILFYLVKTTLKCKSLPLTTVQGLLGNK